MYVHAMFICRLIYGELRCELWKSIISRVARVQVVRGHDEKREPVHRSIDRGLGLSSYTSNFH